MRSSHTISQVSRIDGRTTQASAARELPRIGDKIRLKSGPKAGWRGILVTVRAERVGVSLPDGTRVTVSISGITNYSAAARLAWRTMPKKAGRPVSPHRKIRVSVRIDEAIWRELGILADVGRIRSREHLVNRLLADAVRTLTINRKGARPLSLVAQSSSHSEAIS